MFFYITLFFIIAMFSTFVAAYLLTSEYDGEDGAEVFRSRNPLSTRDPIWEQALVLAQQEIEEIERETGLLPTTTTTIREPMAVQQFENLDRLRTTLMQQRTKELQNVKRWG